MKFIPVSGQLAKAEKEIARLRKMIRDWQERLTHTRPAEPFTSRMIAVQDLLCDIANADLGGE